LYIIIYYIESTLKKLEEFREANFSKINLKRGEGLNQFGGINRESKDGNPKDNEEDVYEEIIKKQRKFKLCGHTDAIFSLSISPDKKYIISGSYDQTIRLWSILTRTNLVVYKGHFSPVLSVKFSSYSYYINL
jgi:WD40 repeat protein